MIPAQRITVRQPAAHSRPLLLLRLFFFITTPPDIFRSDIISLNCAITKHLHNPVQSYYTLYYGLYPFLFLTEILTSYDQKGCKAAENTKNMEKEQDIFILLHIFSSFTHSDYFRTRRDLPVISLGCSIPIISIMVGTMSARQPPSRRV